jgi:hypothetical protein
MASGMPGDTPKRGPLLIVDGQRRPRVEPLHIALLNLGVVVSEVTEAEFIAAGGWIVTKPAELGRE